jgi:hypothetical protein
MRSRWALVDVDRSRDPVIVFIKDYNGKVSVTNEAEIVLNRIRSQYGRSTRLVYIDSNEEWWEIAYEVTQYPPVVFKRWHGQVWDALSN